VSVHQPTGTLDTIAAPPNERKRPLSEKQPKVSVPPIPFETRGPAKPKDSFGTVPLAHDPDKPEAFDPRAEGGSPGSSGPKRGGAAAKRASAELQETSRNARASGVLLKQSITMAVEGSPLVTLFSSHTPLPASTNQSIKVAAGTQTELVVTLLGGVERPSGDPRMLGQLRYADVYPTTSGKEQVVFNFELDIEGVLYVTAVIKGKEHHNTISAG
ncbi:MAG: Hsp70 family protein, partial [Pseudomonadota bacterium]